MNITKEMAAMAKQRMEKLLGTAPIDPMDAQQRDREPRRIATIPELHARDHLDVSEWGDLLADTLRRTHSGMTLVLHIDNRTELFVRTNAPYDTMVLAIIGLIDDLERVVHPKRIVFDDTLLACAARLTVADAAK